MGVAQQGAGNTDLELQRNQALKSESRVFVISKTNWWFSKFNLHLNHPELVKSAGPHPKFDSVVLGRSSCLVFPDVDAANRETAFCEPDLDHPERTQWQMWNQNEGSQVELSQV